MFADFVTAAASTEVEVGTPDNLPTLPFFSFQPGAHPLHSQQASSLLLAGSGNRATVRYCGITHAVSKGVGEQRGWSVHHAQHGNQIQEKERPAADAQKG
eukprot:TRINITY_DN48790_c0_g1_i1.p3 TRINITY_DN48790_c0_g1~~TRINITY_DN48790_c0_g1_i1.p3  ORF type:complete len:100 (-),score=1.13 TRINITY_DN48790_c0_g1_i1:156-455(-)